MAGQNTGIIKFLTEKSLSSLYEYIAVSVICTAVMIWNLIDQKVALNALSTGTPDEKKLLILTIAVVTFCVLFMAVCVNAIREKKENERYSKKTGKRR